MGNGLLIYMIVTQEQWNGANRAISIGKQYTDCPTQAYQQVLLLGGGNVFLVVRSTCLNASAADLNTTNVLKSV